MYMFRDNFHENLHNLKQTMYGYIMNYNYKIMRWRLTYMNERKASEQQRRRTSTLFVLCYPYIYTKYINTDEIKISMN